MSQKKLMLLFVFGLTILIFARPVMPSYASENFGEDCSSCHASGISVSTNATGIVQIETNASFWLHVNADGGTSDDMMLIWSDVSHNSHFYFTPNAVIDNLANDRESEGGKMESLFEITAPDLEGNYTVKIFAASSRDLGGFDEVHITVGAGGEIPRTLSEIVMELLTTFTPIALGGITMLGIVLYIVAWRRIPGGAD